MSDMNRREFVRTSVFAGVAAGTTGERLFGQAPAVARGSVRPVVIACGNGNRFKNGGRATCVEEAFRRLTAGADVDLCGLHRKRIGESPN